MRLALIGQPNCGKSTLFNQVAGYKAETGNFAGTTVSFKETKVRFWGMSLNWWIYQAHTLSWAPTQQNG